MDHHQARRKSSKFMNNISIDDLPDVILLEILCRLPCNKFVFQCKCVSKRWCTVISDPNLFVRAFLRLQSNEKQTPVKTTLINYHVEELLPAGLSDPANEGSVPIWNILRRTLPSKKSSLWVVGTYNDLLLVKSGGYCKSEDYNICNAYPKQWVALPPTLTPQRNEIASGLICDPYNKCRVVRILEVADRQEHTYVYVEIFSSETGEWRSSYMLLPCNFAFCDSFRIGVAYNGMLFWMGRVNHRTPFLIGFDPFSIKSDSTSTDDHGIIDNKCFVEFDKGRIELLGVFQGCLRMCKLSRTALKIWDLKLEPDDRMVNGGDRLILKHRVPMDPKIYWECSLICRPWSELVELHAFEPSNEDILYLSIDRELHMCNIRTKTWSWIADYTNKRTGRHIPLILPPWWPRPTTGIAAFLQVNCRSDHVSIHKNDKDKEEEQQSSDDDLPF